MKTSRLLKLRTLFSFSLAAAALACEAGSSSGPDPDDEDETTPVETPEDPTEPATRRPGIDLPDPELSCTIEAPTTSGAWEVDTGLDEATVPAITATETALFLFDGRALRRSSDGGATWQRLHGLPLTFVRAAAGSADDLFITGYRNGVGSATFRSKDDGATWSEVAELAGQSIQHLRSQGPAVVADGFFWTPESDVFTAFTNDDFLFLFSSDGKTHLGAAYAQTFRSTDGVGWTEITDLSGIITSRLAIAGELALALDSAGALYRSVDGGVTFTAVAFDAEALGAVGDFVIRDGDILVATTKGLARSLDGGVSFVLEVQSTATFADPFFNESPRIAETGDRIVLSAAELYLSTDGGDTWGEAPKLIDATPFAVGATRDYLFASTLDGKLHASSESSSWFEIDSQGYMMRDFASDKDTHFFLLRAASPDGIAYFADGAVVSLKDGDSEFGYVERPADNYQTTFSELHVHDGVLLLGSESMSTGSNGSPTPYGRGLYRSTDGGAHWEPSSDGIASVGVDPYSYDDVYPAIVELHSFGDHLFVALGDGTVMRSTDRGLSWSDASTGLDTFDPEAPNGTDLFGSTGGTLLSASSRTSLLFGFDPESGSWMSVPGVGLPAHFRLSTLMGHGGVFFAAVRSAQDEVGGVYFSLDGGVSWQNAGLAHSMRTIGLRKDVLFAGTDGDGLWSLDLGPCEAK